MKAVAKILKGKTGGILLLTIIILSLMIVLLMSAATLKLAEVARHGERLNEQMRFMNAMEDLAQLLYRAKVLGDTSATAGCPGATTRLQVGTQYYCFANTGVTSVGGLAGVCVDLDQSTSTTHDQYCLGAVSDIVGQQNLDEFNQRASEKYFARQSTTFKDKVVRFLSSVLIPSADAVCAWYGCPTTDQVLDTAGAGGATAVTRTFPPLFTVNPAGTATEITASAVAVARNNMEPWSPNIASWGANNEMYTPNCGSISTTDGDPTQNLFWIGCIRCNAQGITCKKIGVCPARNPGCNTATEGYEQMLGMW